jgi:hypothetical protein
VFVGSLGDDRYSGGDPRRPVVAHVFDREPVVVGPTGVRSHDSSGVAPADVVGDENDCSPLQIATQGSAFQVRHRPKRDPHQRGFCPTRNRVSCGRRFDFPTVTQPHQDGVLRASAHGQKRPVANRRPMPGSA